MNKVEQLSIGQEKQVLFIFCISIFFSFLKSKYYKYTKGYFAIQELLLFAELNANAGNELKATSEQMHRQNSINENFLKQLLFIGPTSKQLCERVLQELMITIISKRLIFSDDFLSLVWKISIRDTENPLQSELWKVIKNQCIEIIQNGNKKDWYWLKKVLIPSTVTIYSFHIVMVYVFKFFFYVLIFI